jgi:acetyl-CoA carboxylase biotin carboxyl carrier protein
MDFKELKRIVQLVENSAIEELEVEQEGFRIRVRKGSLTQTLLTDRILPPPGYVYDTGATRIHLGHLHPAPESEISREQPPETIDAEPSTGVIKSPMVGTFYRAPSPDSAPFVQIGSIVEPETVVCILEAMKVMNEIKAGLYGKISEVLVENSNPVEFGQPLFRVIPA